MARPRKTTTSGAPLTELGTTYPFFGPPIPGISRVQPFVDFVQEQETVWELTWPTSVYYFNRMRNDSQVDSLYLASTLPIRRYRWMLDPNGCPTDMVDKLSEDLGIPVKGSTAQRRKRRQNRVDWEKFMREAFLALIYGHMYFELVGEIDDSGMWRLRKLAPRMPHTISQIRVAQDGGLVSIVQTFNENSEIPVDRLVGFIHEQEGANWVGRSMLRSCYQNWLLKDRELRVDAIRHERNGMGVPIVELPERATGRMRDQANALAQNYKTGEASGGALPNGMKLRLVGVEGQVSDVLASIKYHDEAMARKFLAMFVQLGVTKSGSRALGESFIEFFDKSQETIANWFTDTVNFHVIEDWVNWNYGDIPDTTPLLVYEKDSQPDLSITELDMMIKDGMITVDDDLEVWFRERHLFPDLNGKPREEAKAAAADLMKQGAGAGGGSANPQVDLPVAPSQLTAKNTDSSLNAPRQTA